MSGTWPLGVKKHPCVLFIVGICIGSLIDVDIQNWTSLRRILSDTSQASNFYVNVTSSSNTTLMLNVSGKDVRPSINGTAAFSTSAKGNRSSSDSGHNRHIPIYPIPNVSCFRDKTGTDGWASTVLRLSGVHVQYKSSEKAIVVTAPPNFVRMAQEIISTCEIDGHVPNHKPRIVVKEALDLKVDGPVQIQFYGNDVQRQRNRATMKNLKVIADCFGLHMSNQALADPTRQVGIQPGCYGHVSVGFFFHHRPVHYPQVKESDCVHVPELKSWIRKAHRHLQRCREYEIRLTATNKNWLFVHRTSPGDDRKIQTTGRLPRTILESRDTDPITWNNVERLIAVEGATFANQIFMPLGSTLVQIHIPYKHGLAGPSCWHSGVAQYLNHTFVSVVLSTATVDLTKLGLLIGALEDIRQPQFCVIHDMQLPFQCRLW